jgi:hypothetical protein
MKTVSFYTNQVLAYLVTRIPLSLVENLTLFDSKIKKWYEKNNTYKFAIGRTIALKARNIFGYGVRPIAIVKGYNSDGNYILIITSDKNGNFRKWMKNNSLSENVEIDVREVTCFKWNVEYKFRVVY